MSNEAKKLKKFVMQVPKCGVEPAGWEVTFYNGGSGNQTETEYKWDFQNIDLSKISVKAWEGQSNASKIHTDYTVGDLANVVLTADYSIASNPAALTLTLEKEKGEYNLIDNDKASGDAKKELGASNGCIDPNADAVVSTSGLS